MGSILGVGGADANGLSDLTLLAYLFLILPTMIAGFVFARRKMFVPYHKITMTTITLVNWVIIIFLMAQSYGKWVAPSLSEGFSTRYHLVPTVHLVLGGSAQLLATYLVILMWTERTPLAWIVPKPLRITRIKPVMRLTLTLWIVTILFGLGTYLIWYPPQVGGAVLDATPVVTEEPPEATEVVEETPVPESTEDASVMTDETPEAPAPEATEVVEAMPVPESTEDGADSADDRDDDNNDAPDPDATEDAAD